MSDTITGILKRVGRQQFVVRTGDHSYRKDQIEIMVLPELAKQYALTEGAAVTGQVKRNKGKARLVSIETLGGMEPKAFGKRPRFSDMVAIDPHQRFELGLCGNKTMRIIDLIAPIGKGTRQLIISPPKAGKTVLLEQMITGIHECSPSSRIIVLLIDERPEEVTQFRRAAKYAEVIASTSDQSIDEHVALAELVLSHVQTELECGREVVVMIDSLTRVSRAFNSRGNRRGSRRGTTMSGGLESGAMEIPRRLFGLARTIENGGSVTIIATCLVDTGSRMDQMIFEEFKGTGNSEIVLDRSLAEARIFPAIDIPASGTRKEANLYSPDHNRGLAILRRVLSSYGTGDAIESLFKLLNKYSDNTEFLDSLCSGKS
ncbi:MAG: transcription termination factor Rho [Planctomycetes bacterium]|nr:transcription termination factor Rho [Planctomycetota bacterium]